MRLWDKANAGIVIAKYQEAKITVDISFSVQRVVTIYQSGIRNTGGLLVNRWAAMK